MFETFFSNQSKLTFLENHFFSLKDFFHFWFFFNSTWWHDILSDFDFEKNLEKKVETIDFAFINLSYRVHVLQSLVYSMYRIIAICSNFRQNTVWRHDDVIMTSSSINLGLFKDFTIIYNVLVLFVNIGIPNGYRPVNHETVINRIVEVVSTSDWSNLDAWIYIAPFAFSSACTVWHPDWWIFQLQSLRTT